MIINNDANPTGFGHSESDYIGFEPSPLDWTKLENTFKKRPSVTGGWDLHYKANLVSPF